MPRARGEDGAAAWGVTGSVTSLPGTTPGAEYEQRYMGVVKSWGVLCDVPVRIHSRW